MNQKYDRKEALIKVPVRERSVTEGVADGSNTRDDVMARAENRGNTSWCWGREHVPRKLLIL